MPEIKLNGPAVVNGAIRYPVEGLIPVSDAEADRLFDGGFLDLDEHDGDDGLDGLKVEDLKKTAADEGIDLGEATKKSDIIAAIRAARSQEA